MVVVQLTIHRLDMTALKHKSDVSTLIGAPRGYTESEKDGTLTGVLKGLQKESLKDTAPGIHLVLF